ncbi:MAG: HDOD domain-containing protein [Ignavibacteria bacterium]|nr:MAG: HDOD domain-containing protein [Ignavibacteria bacterium]
MKILFVDDEKNILSGLKRMLHSQSKEWEMVFLDTAEEAIQYIDNEKVDILVTDMKMPGMDGISLLDYVTINYPEVIRIILTGHTDEKYIIRSVRISHQFILKPCSKDELITRIKKIYNLKKYIVNEDITKVISQIEKIPALPENYLRLEKELNSEAPSMHKICDIIEKEPAVSAKLLQIVNSAYFNLPSTVVDIQQALNILGLNSLRSIVLYSEIFQKTPPLKTKLFTLDKLWLHSLRIANLSKVIFEGLTGNSFLAKHAYIAGLLHDIGYLLISQTENYDLKLTAYLNEENNSFHDAELHSFGTTHAEIGAYLLSVWNLPEPIVNAVGEHHSSEINVNEPEFSDAVKLAQLFDTNESEFEKELSAIDPNIKNKVIKSLQTMNENILT